MVIESRIVLGNKIKEIRKKNNLTQNDLAKMTGLSKNAIWNYEKGKRTPNIEILSKIANALDVTINDIAGNKETALQNYIKEILEQGFDIKDISNSTNIPLIRIYTILGGSNDVTINEFIALGQFKNLDSQEIGRLIMDYVYKNSIDNNNSDNAQENLFKKILLGEQINIEDLKLASVNVNKDPFFIESLLLYLNRKENEENDKNNSSDSKLNIIKNNIEKLHMQMSNLSNDIYLYEKKINDEIKSSQDDVEIIKRNCIKNELIESQKKLMVLQVQLLEFMNKIINEHIDIKEGDPDGTSTKN